MLDFHRGRNDGIPYAGKVHQGLPDVRLMLDQAPSRQTLLVHAPKAVTDRVLERLRAEDRTGLYSLQPGAELDI